MIDTLRQRLSIFFISCMVFASCALAQSTLSQIQDTVYTPNGALLNGTVVITWTGSTNPTGNSPAPYNTTVKIYNGALSVLLAPSTSIMPIAYYQAVYNSSDGLATWTEMWQVPPSSSPLTLAQIRVSNVNGSGGGGGGGNNGTSITMGQVTGLNSYLSALSSSIASVTTLANGLNSTIAAVSNSLNSVATQVNALAGGSTNAVFSDAESPTGQVNGTNAAFTVTNTPSTPASLMLYRNGILQANGTDYTLSGANITFQHGEIPQSGDILVAYYRTSGTGPLSSSVDAEVPQGTIDAQNLTFTLNTAPKPAMSLKLFKNGMLLEQSIDYRLSGATITFASTGVTPHPGDSLAAYYRITAGQ
ncbi:MAG: hypothetical protein JO091_00090 [Acidobacteriaceae bacterium]|nr:hypothetical protein [Acidobacteriaceae bacterium]